MIVQAAEVGVVNTAGVQRRVTAADGFTVTEAVRLTPFAEAVSVIAC